MSGGVSAKPGDPGQWEAIKPQAECRKLGGGWRWPPGCLHSWSLTRGGWDARGLKAP